MSTDPLRQGIGRQERETPTNRLVTSVLLASHLEEDHVLLRNILSHSNWEYHRASSIQETLSLLHAASVVICQRNLPPSGWKTLFEETRKVPLSPKFIVSTQEPDAEVWAEALNIGADDVLVTPFEAKDVFWIVGHAHLLWIRAMELSATR